MKKNNKKGFTLAELLIVVAIIAVLVAIAIPIFNAQLEKSRDATDQANIRDAYAEFAVKLLDEGFSSGVLQTSYKVSGKGTNDKWDNLDAGSSFTIGGIEESTRVPVSAKAKFGTITFSWNEDGALRACTLS